MAQAKQSGGKFQGLIVEAQKDIKPETQKAINTEAQKAVPEEITNLTIKVKARHRRHWAAEAKRQGVTITSIIVEALNKQFGEP